MQDILGKFTSCSAGLRESGVPPHLRPDPFFPELGPRGGDRRPPCHPVRERQRRGQTEWGGHQPSPRESQGARASLTSIIIIIRFVGSRRSRRRRWRWRCSGSFVFGSTSTSTSNSTSSGSHQPARQGVRGQRTSRVQGTGEGGGKQEASSSFGWPLRIVWSEEEREREETGPRRKKTTASKVRRGYRKYSTQQMSRFLG